MAHAKSMGNTASSSGGGSTVLRAGGTTFPWPATDYSASEFVRLIEAIYGTHFGYNNSNDDDRVAAHVIGAALTFGEVRPEGVAKMLDGTHLNARNAKVLFDIGCGFGKLALQAFLSFDNLDKVVGVELCKSRYAFAAQTLRTLADANPQLFSVASTHDTITIGVAKPNGKGSGQRTLQLRNRNLFDTKDLTEADVVVCETDIPLSRQADLTVLLSQLKGGVRFLLYHRLNDLPGTDVTDGGQRAQLYDAKDVCRRVLARVTAIAPSDTYDASWGNPHFDVWRRNA